MEFCLLVIELKEDEMSELDVHFEKCDASGVKYDNISMAKAILISVNQMRDSATMIRWTKKWGYIIIDRKARATLHGHQETSLDLYLFGISQEASTWDWDIFENDDGDLIFLVPHDWQKGVWFKASDITQAIQEKKGSVFPHHPKGKTGDWLKNMKTNYQHQIVMEGIFLEYSLRPSFEFHYDKKILPKSYCGGGVVIEEQVENSYSSKKKEYYTYRGEWSDWCKMGTYTEKDMVLYEGALYIHPCEKGNPYQSWTLFRQAESVSVADSKDDIFKGIPHKSKTFNKGTMRSVNSICIVKKNGYLEMMCGHMSGYYSLWRLPVTALYIQNYRHDLFQVIKSQSNIIENIDSEQLIERCRNIHNSNKNIEEI